MREGLLLVDNCGPGAWSIEPRQRQQRDPCVDPSHVVFRELSKLSASHVRSGPHALRSPNTPRSIPTSLSLASNSGRSFHTHILPVRTPHPCHRAHCAQEAETATKKRIWVKAKAASAERGPLTRTSPKRSRESHVIVRAALRTASASMR